MRYGLLSRVFAHKSEQISLVDTCMIPVDRSRTQEKSHAASAINSTDRFKHKKLLGVKIVLFHAGPDGRLSRLLLGPGT